MNILKTALIASLVLFLIFSLNLFPNAKAQIAENWQTRETQHVSGVFNNLRAVSAISANDIWAVGIAGTKALTLHWDGLNWSVVPIPELGTQVNLRDVVALSSDNVWAVGDAADSSLISKTLIIHWNGSSWSKVDSPNFNFPDTSTFNRLNGISAVSANDIWAVGDANINNQNTALAIHWDGSSWQMVSLPQSASYLNSVEAISTSNVWAVGGTSIIHWNGSSWQIIPGPSIPSPYGLNSISALSSSDIWAAGSSVNGSNPNTPLILRWNGSFWSIVPSIDKSKTIIRGIEVISSSNVWAVGVNGTSETTAQNFIMHWDGSNWSESPTPNPGVYNDLHDLAVVTPQNIWAVGWWGYDPQGLQRNLILHYQQISSSPSPTPSPSPSGPPTPKPSSQPVRISFVSDKDETTTTARITWRTNVKSTSRVVYGLSKTALTNSTSEDPTVVTSHSVSLANLTKNTRYYYQVFSKNATGVEYSSSINSFKTKSR